MGHVGRRYLLDRSIGSLRDGRRSIQSRPEGLRTLRQATATRRLDLRPANHSVSLRDRRRTSGADSRRQIGPDQLLHNSDKGMNSGPTQASSVDSILSGIYGQSMFVDAETKLVMVITTVARNASTDKDSIA